MPATLTKDDKLTKPNTRNQDNPELSSDFGMQFTTGSIYFTPYREFITLRNQVEELIKKLQK